MSMKERMKKIINYKYVKTGKETLQKKAIKALGAFLFVMIMCTMLSRFADSLTIPLIQTEKPKAKTMVEEVKAQGRIVKNREEKISILEGLKVEYVNVNVGSAIKVGDTIVELNIPDLQKKAEEIRESISKEQKTLDRAIEDYNRAIDSKNQTVQSAFNEMNAAKKALDDFLNSKKDEKDEADKENNKLTQDSLTAEYESKKAMYEAAVQEANNTVDLDRTFQDIKESLQLDEYNEKLAEIQPFLDTNGKVVSTKEGIVTSVFVENGGVTSDSVISLADKNTGYKFVGQIEKDKRTLIKQGQAVALNLNGSGSVDKLTIEAVAASQENPEYLDVIVMLPVGIGQIDDTGEIIISSKVQKFATCVPVSALRQGDGNTNYILVVSEKETVLGTEKIAKKVEVRIEQKDGEFAALSNGAIGNREEVIVGSNKIVEDGDRVRPESE